MNSRKGTENRNFAWLRSTIREDLKANKRHWERPGFHALVVFRFGTWALGKGGPLGLLANIAYRLVYPLVRNIYSVELPRGTQVGHRLWLPHPAGIVISYRSEIGDDCLILQNVTIGLGGKRGRKRPPPHAPRIGNGVEIGAGAVLIGGITIGDGARIGPNSVVTTDVPAGGTAIAAPSKIMKPLQTSTTEKTNDGTAEDMEA